MKFSISNIAWPCEWDNEIFIKLNELGFNAIEIAPNRTIPQGYEATNEQIDQWNKHYLNLFGEISSMQSLLFKVEMPIFESNENMDYILNLLRNGLIFASKLKVRNIVFGSPSIRNVHNKKELERSKLFFELLAKEALSYRISVALEPNPIIYNTNFLNTTIDALEYIKQINHPNLGINLDFGTIFENKESIHDIMTKENVSLIKHVHISEPYLLKINTNRRKIHIELLKSLKDFDYNGYISIEMKLGCTQEEIFETLNYVKAIGIESGAFNEK